MSLAARIVFGVVPASFLLMMGLTTLGLISNIRQKALLATAVLGYCGLIWSLVGYTRRTATVVLILLLIGVLGVLVGGLWGAVHGFATDARNSTLGSPLAVFLRVLLLSWLILCPAVVGLVEVGRAVRMLRAERPRA